MNGSYTFEHNYRVSNECWCIRWLKTELISTFTFNLKKFSSDVVVITCYTEKIHQ